MTQLATWPPQTGFATRDPGFADVLGDDPRLVEVVCVDAHEGPVYVADEDALYVTSVPHRPPGTPERPLVAIERIALHGERYPVDAARVSVVSCDANVANGMTLDTDGSLLVCEQGTFATPARIARVDRATGHAESVVEAHAGRPLNSPNDVVVARDGAIWFTDPSYGHLQGFRPRPVLADAVYRFDPASGAIDAVADGLDKPNGLAFAPDGTTLYVADSGAIHEPGSFDPRRPHHVLAFDVVDGIRLGSGRLFAEVTPGFPDGLKVDTAGRVYVTSASGVQVFAPDGTLLGEILVPGAVNFCFGGPGGNVLYITSDTAVTAAVLLAKGA
jgi:gluconolactonase